MKKRIFLGVAILALILSIQTLTVSAQEFAFDIPRSNWHPSVRSGATFYWKLTDVTTNDTANPNEWTWMWGNNITLVEGEYIIIEVENTPDPWYDPGVAGGLDQYLEFKVYVGNSTLEVRDELYTKLDAGYLADFSDIPQTTPNLTDAIDAFEPETFFHWLISPVFVNNSVNVVESGVWSLERFWFNTFLLPGAYIPTAYGQYLWTFDCQNESAGLEKMVGPFANPGDILFCNIMQEADFFFYLAWDPVSQAHLSHWLIPGVMFDVEYDATTGIVNKASWPGTAFGGYPSVPDMAVPLYNSTYNYGWAAGPGDDVYALQSLELTYNGSYIYQADRPVGDPIYRPTMADLYEFEWPAIITEKITETKMNTITITETETKTITEQTSDIFGITAILGMVAVIVVVRRRK